MNTKARSWLLGLAILPVLSRPLSAQACGPTVITESVSQDIVSGNSIACTDPGSGFTFENHYTRAFELTDFGIQGGFAVCEVEVAVEAALSVAGSQTLTVYLYSTQSGSFPGGVLTPLGTASLVIDDQDQSFVTIPVTGTAPPGTQLVVDVASEDGTVNLSAFSIGSNSGGQTAPGYLTAPDCGLITPTDLAGPPINQPDMDIVINVRGTEVATALPASPLRVDEHTGTGVISNQNGVFETGETVLIETSWSNPVATSFSLTGLAQNFTGLSGPVYTISGNAADYGTLAAQATNNCYDATGTCFQLQITGARPTQHWDATFDETVTLVPSPGAGIPSPTHTWVLHVGESFPDVPVSHFFYPFVETIFHDGVTGGCAA